MQSSILSIHVLIAICLVALILLQHGKGTDIGAAFGSSASNTMFGSTGATPFLMKLTIILAAGFFCYEYRAQLSSITSVASRYKSATLANRAI